MLRSGTYSIVARDPSTGEVGAAVQSHWFSVGSIVSWAAPGVGAVCTQANAEPAYGPNLLRLMADGAGAREALDALLARDPQGPHRQVAVVSASGEVAAHTGAECMPVAGHTTGDGFSCQANIMANDTVWGAMAEAFEASEGPLAHRLLTALRAAEAAGGDIRGRQSCAIVVAPAEGDVWRRSVDLRVEDHPEPLDEMGRLLDVHEAYALATRGDELVAEGRHQEAGQAYQRAAELAPGNHELLFWAGLAAAQSGDMDVALQRVRRAIELQPGWAELLPRLPASVAPSAAAVHAALTGA